jgi:hypothetical protein
LLYNSFGGNLKALKAGVGNLKFVNWNKTAHGMAPPLSDTIYLGDEYIGGNENQVLHRILHEIAHRFDFEGAGISARKYKSEMFVQEFNENDSCDRGPLGCIGPKPPFWAYKLFAGVGDYKVTTRNVSKYAINSGSIEDLAESFGSYILDDNGVTIPLGETTDPSRLHIIKVWIDVIVDQNK